MRTDKSLVRSKEWIEKMKKIHPEYDYSQTKYTNCHSSVVIICLKHGGFNVQPKAFAKIDYKCAKCKKEELIKEKKIALHEKLKDIHPEYEYDMSTFQQIKGKMRMVCPEHGEFWQCVSLTLKGSGCPKCSFIKGGIKNRKTLGDFIKQSKEIHGDKYDYSKVKYINSITDVCIICPDHGEFWQRPISHLNNGGCQKCSKTYRRNKEDFINDANEIHNNKYDYSKINYIDTHHKICIVCHEKDVFGRQHGEFWQTPKAHLRGDGCKKCSNTYLDKDLFVLKSNVIYGDKYDYSKVNYIGNKKKVCIICPEHGEFWQVPNSHLSGRGCPSCNESHLERNVRLTLGRNNINFSYQFHDKNIFGKQSLDFFLPDYNIAIECQGEQHFLSNFYKSVNILKANDRLEYIQSLDRNKKRICSENDIHLIYFLEKKFSKYMSEDDIYFTDLNELINYIINYNK